MIKGRQILSSTTEIATQSHHSCFFEGYRSAVIPVLFSGPSSVQALGISPSYRLPISVCRTCSLLPGIIGAFQAIQFVAPIILNDQFSKRTLLINTAKCWQIWVNLAWVEISFRFGRNIIANRGEVRCLWVSVIRIHGWSHATMVRYCYP